MAFGSRYAFVTEGNDEYVFPLVGLLSKAQSHTIRKTRELLHSMARDSRYREMFENNLDFSINAGLSCFQEQTATVIRKREGLDGRAETLEEIARQLGLTRERVRQIESKFWTRQKYLKDDSVFEPFLHGFLSEFIKNNGRRVIERTHPMRFLAKCLEVPEARVLKTSLLLLGSDKEFLRLDPDDLESFVKEIRWLCEKDLDVLASAYEPIFREKRKKSQKVFMALESIGRPAHFSEVAKKYVELFPDDIMSENSVHAILNRQGGTIVWVGAKGIYALSKWGYERPEKSLFDTVADIVKSIYEATGRPVTFNAIMAEIGKHRKVVVPSSIPMALAFNDRIKRLSKDQYSPASETKEDKAGFDERLDQALREFMDQSD
jgi:transcriptional regulator with XRE-family HTH domain